MKSLLKLKLFEINDCLVNFRFFSKGVHFRYHTYKFANKLKLAGWVQNTLQSTVIGTAQGNFNDLAAFTYWLENKGSPHSRIDKLELTNCRIIESINDRLGFQDFRVKQSYASVKQETVESPESSKEIEEELRKLGKLKFESQNA